MNENAEWIKLAGSTGPARTAWSALDEAYASPDRSYHGWQHIRECLTHLDSWEEIHGPAGRAMRFAIFFHDIVYIPGSRDNEHESAVTAQMHLRRMEEDPAVISETIALIEATAHLAAGAPQTGADLMLDIDLAILGAPRERFREYDEQVREEYSTVPLEQFRQGRAAVLEEFLGRSRIYRTGYFHDRLEERARINLSEILVDLYSSV